MADLNSVTLSGNLTRDPELRDLPSGKKVVSLRLASAGFGDRSGYYDVTAWEKLAELITDAFSKGSRFTFTGRVEYREWDDKEGNRRNAVSFIANDVVWPKRDQADDDDEIGF
jgi:single-strand DNA-binding protein